MGSVGVGCTINDEIIVSVEKSTSDETIFDGTTINFPTVHSVIKELSPQPVRVSIKSPLPLGYGFGISSASALACAYALDKLFNLKKSELELAKIAHTAEIENYTGLGSVATQITGGFLVKNKPGIPVEAYKLPFAGRKLYTVIIDRLETPTVLHDNERLKIINKFADKALNQISTMHNITLEEVVDISYQFAKNSNLMIDERLISIIEYIRNAGGHACMAMLGKVIITDQKPHLKENYPVYELTISNKIISY